MLLNILKLAQRHPSWRRPVLVERVVGWGHVGAQPSVWVICRWPSMQKIAVRRDPCVCSPRFPTQPYTTLLPELVACRCKRTCVNVARAFSWVHVFGTAFWKFPAFPLGVKCNAEFQTTVHLGAFMRPLSAFYICPASQDHPEPRHRAYAEPQDSTSHALRSGLERSTSLGGRRNSRGKRAAPEAPAVDQPAAAPEEAPSTFRKELAGMDLE